MGRQPGDTALVIFTRLPVEGKVKTRLIPVFGYSRATMLYASLVDHTFACCSRAGYRKVQVWLTGEGEQNPYLQRWRQQYDFDFYLQRGSDLGERMFNAFSYSLQRHDAAVLVGCDCPGLGVDELIAANEALYRPDTAVIGPASDGGYYLLGLNRCHYSLFDGICWGSAEVARLTKERLTRLGLGIVELAEKFDIDRPEDVVRWLGPNTDGFDSVR